MRYLLILFSLLVVTSALAQSHGISYQAILMEETDQELPGIDVPGGILPNKSIAIRFTITRQSGGTVYQEVHQHTTDDYGLINVVIGNGNVTGPTNFIDIDWDGTPMDLKVEIDLLEGASFENFSEQELFFVPYAFHRNITATGTLDVNQITTLGDDLNVSGITTLDSDLIVANGSPTTLTGDLTVEGETTLTDLELSGDLLVRGVTNLEGVLSVNNNSPSFLSGDLLVEGITTLTSSFIVADGSASTLSGTLLVEGAATFMEAMNINNTFSVETNNASFIASFYNTNGTSGDGLLIKLGNARTNLTPPSVETLNTDQLDAMRSLLNCDLSDDAKVLLLGEIALEGAIEDAQMLAGIVVELGNELIGFINSRLGLPLGTDEIDLLLEIVKGINGGGPAPGVCGSVGDCLIPDDLVDPDSDAYVGGQLILPALKFPVIPEIDLSYFGIDPIDLTSTDFWGIPSLCLEDIGTPLNNQNEFITFMDVNDSKMGSVRAVSAVDWTKNYLNPVFLYKLRKGFTSSTVDKNHAKYHGKSMMKEAMQSYASIGVEYSSTNGDYAEWLERINIEEIINKGEIVGVKGGKITKDLSESEQVMVVSHFPIVMGNVPPEEKVASGNTVAFMGQVPVKVMGPVNSGDYILGNPNTPGFGIARNPLAITPEDLVLAVGRSWDTDLDEGPKFVNTVIGVHNGEYTRILKKFEDRFNENEARLKSMESKLETLTELVIKANN